MKKLLFALFAGAVLCCAAVDGVDVTGKWSGFPIYLTLKQEGNKVSGSAGQSEDDQIPFQGGTLEDNRLILKFGPMEINVVVDGDTMSGDMTSGSNNMKLVFRRVKPRDPSAPPLTFDAATVKRSEPAALGKGTSSNMRAAPGRITGTNNPLKRYIVAAWGLKDYQVSGPEWLADERYDITATMPAGIPPNDVLAMLQTLLKDRFGLVTHFEKKELPVYALVVDKNGPKLKPAESFGGISVNSSPKGRTLKANATMKTFAGTLSSLVDRPVIDMTELTGGFNINLEWAPEENQGGPKPIEGASADSMLGPTIFTALHEAGLKLEARKAPVEMLVVDHAEKVPAEN